MFWETMFRRFVEHGPPATLVADGKYSKRTVKSCKAHFGDLSAEVQKFFSALRRVKASNPTGVNDDNILSMAVALHMGKTLGMDYNFKDYFQENWNAFKAFKVLQDHPKWNGEYGENCSSAHGRAGSVGGTGNAEASSLGGGATLESGSIDA
eukprot:IDg23290t1